MYQRSGLTSPRPLEVMIKFIVKIQIYIVIDKRNAPKETDPNPNQKLDNDSKYGNIICVEKRDSQYQD